jgi:micrococcal nuclease
MPFTREQLDQVLSGLERALSSKVLNDWERKFLIDMRAKLQRHGTRTSLSEKQHSKLMQLASVSKNPTRFRPGKAIPAWPGNTKTRGRSRVPYWVKREVRSFSRRMLLNLFMLFVILAVIGLVSIGREGFTAVERAAVPAYATRAVFAEDIGIIDGDTVRIRGEAANVRLVGFNTPEVSSAGCSREERLGRRATARLSDLLRTAATVEFQRVRCSCPPGTEGTSRCNYGRSCGTLRVDGRDVGDVLISEGLAVLYLCGPTSCPPRPGDWCGG